MLGYGLTDLTPWKNRLPCLAAWPMMERFEPGRRRHYPALIGAKASDGATVVKG